MKTLRSLGSLAFVIGLFFMVFVAAPWHIYHEPALEWWMKIAIYVLMGGIFLVLAALVVEQKKIKTSGAGSLSDELSSRIMIHNSSEIHGREITESLGLVKGHTIFAIWIGKDLSALLRLVLGGELTEYTEMMGWARKVATERMLAQAEKMGADAIVNVRYMTTSVVGRAAERIANCTAVKLRK